MASWADPLSRVEINFYFYGAFRRMMLPPSMLLICKIFFIMDLFQRAGFTRRYSACSAPPRPSGGCPRTSPLSRILGRSVKVSKAKRAARTPDRRLSEEYTGLIIIRALLLA